jgi:hypothetical protein
MALLTARSDRSRAMNWIQIVPIVEPRIGDAAGVGGSPRYSTLDNLYYVNLDDNASKHSPRESLNTPWPRAQHHITSPDRRSPHQSTQRVQPSKA